MLLYVMSVSYLSLYIAPMIMNHDNPIEMVNDEGLMIFVHHALKRM